MRVSVDSELYINNAINLTQGEIPDGREFFYSSYSLLIAIVYLINLDPLYTIFFHLLSALAAIICIYKITQQISNKNATAFIAALLYVVWIKFQQWNLILYTDALFANLVVVSTYVLFTAKKPPQMLLALVLIVFTSLLRPLGIGLLLAVIVYLGFSFFKRSKINLMPSVLIYSLVILVSILSINKILSPFIDSFIESYSNAEVIYPKISLFMSKPESLIIPNKDHEPLIRLLLIIFKNPLYFIKISTIKGLLFIGHIKPYYSRVHNALIIGFLYPIYFFAAKGYKLLPTKKVKLFIFMFIGFQFLAVSLTSENWDGRFLLAVLPFIFVLSALGIMNSAEKTCTKR